VYESRVIRLQSVYCEWSGLTPEAEQLLTG